MSFEKDLIPKYGDLECENLNNGEIYLPNLMKLKSDLELEGYTLESAMQFTWEKPLVLRDNTKVYNKFL